MEAKLGRKITVIGAGAVGATIAYSLSQRSHASEVVLIDVNEKKANGEALDIVQSTSFRDPIRIVAGDYEEARDSDIVIITSGVARKPGQTRLELAKTNVGIIKDIAPKITAVAPNAIYVLVANPVDVLTYVFTKVSGSRRARLSAPARSLIPRDSSASWRRSFISHRRMCTAMYLVSMVIPRSFRGRRFV